MSFPTAPVAAGSLIAGFAVAQGTGVRAVGGVVLLAGAVWCGRLWWQRVGVAPAAGLLATYAAGFVLSHLLARSIGAWPSVLTVAAVMAAAAWLVADARTVPDGPAA
jgi:hypothetical protein